MSTEESRLRYLIVDGHSMIFAHPELLQLHQKRMELGREELVKMLTRYQDATGDRVVVVFDGKGKRMSSEQTTIQVMYSKSDQTADQIIERLVVKYGKQHDLTVATNDNMEQQTVITFGGMWMSSEMLFNRIEEADKQVHDFMKQRSRKAKRGFKIDF